MKQRRVFKVLRAACGFGLLTAMALLVFLPRSVMGQSAAGSALTLQGRDWIRANSAGALAQTANAGFELWFKTAGAGALINEADVSDVAQWDYLLANVLSDGTVVAGMPGLPFVIVGKIAFNQWHHLTISYNETSRVFAAYLDGNAPVTSSGTRHHPSANGRAVNYAFGRGGPVNLGASSFFAGQMDEIRIWNTPLEPSFVALYWNRTVTDPIPGLIANWHFDVTNGHLSPDASGNNNPSYYFDPLGTVITPLSTSTAPLLAPAPTVTTQAASVTGNVVTLNGTADPNGAQVSAYFEWGATTAYGNSTVPSDLPVISTPTTFAANLSGLAPGEYHARAVLNFGAVRVLGNDVVFTVASPAGQAVRLVGTDWFRSGKQSNALFPAEEFTIETWFFATSPGVLISEVDAVEPAMWDYAFAELFADGTLRAALPGMPTVQAGNNLLNSWHHIALVYSVSQQLFTVYLDGQAVASQAGGRFTPTQAGRGAYVVFGRGISSNLGGGQFFVGLMDETRIWSAALTVEDIRDGFDRLLVAFDSSLKSYWHFDTASGTSSPDATPNNTAAIGSAPLSLTTSRAPVVEDTRASPTGLTVVNKNSLVATLSGTINTFNLASVAALEYVANGQTIRTPFQTVPVGGAFSQEALLNPGTSYQVRIVTSNSAGILRGPTVTFVKGGYGGNAMRLAPNDYLRTVAGQNGNFPTDNITLELWIKPIPNRACVIASETDFGNTVALDRSIIELTSAGFVIASFEGLPTITLGKIVANQWHHIAIRYNSVTQSLDGFFDGTKTASSSGNRLTPVEKSTTGYLAFGKTVRISMQSTAYYSGEMDEIRVWNVARTDAEIRNDRGQITPGQTPGLVLAWSFDEPQTPLIEDGSSLSNRGQNFGADIIVSTAPLTFAPILISNTGNVQLQFVVNTGFSYQLESTSDFKTWAAGPTANPSAQGILRFSVPADTAAPALFYRPVPK